MNAKLILAALCAALLTPGVQAQAPAPGMDMGGMKMAQQPKAVPLSVTAAISPAAPRTGDNTLDLTILDAAGKPVTGLKLTATVAMTSMDMGTTRPAVTETGNGHYTAKVNFGMDGPWRVVVRSQANKIAVLDFQAGAKTPWMSPQSKAAGATPGVNTAPAARAMPNTDKNDGMAGMDMSETTTGTADMKTAIVPRLQEQGTYTATGDEDWKAQTGFGHNAAMVGMMNQMMVGGSGMEGMKMPPVTMKFDEQNYAKPAAGEADGAMPGMNMSAPTADGNASAPSAVTITATTASAPKAGDNPLTIRITDAQGRPVTGAKITATVAMTSMDMGTTHPAVTEKSGGQYSATATFSMAGPWRVSLKVTPPGGPPQIKTFDFTAK